MPRADTSFGPGGIANTVLEREPTPLPRQGDFFADLEKFRRVFGGTRRPASIAAALPTSPAIGRNVPPPAVTEQMSPNSLSRVLKDRRRERQAEFANLAPAAVEMRGGPNTVAGYVESTLSSPGAAFTGYRDRRDVRGPASFANSPSSVIGGSLSALSGLGGVGGRSPAMRALDGGEDDERADFFGTGTTNRGLQVATLAGRANEREKARRG